MLEQLSLFRLLPEPADRGRERHLLLNGRAVPYALHQKARRRLAMTIDERGLRIGAPKGLSLQEIEAFARSHGEWILAKLDEYAARVPRQLAIRDGVRLPLLDAEVMVRVEAGGNRVRWTEAQLVLAARPEADLSALVRRALQGRAREHFSARLTHFAALGGLAPPPLGLSSARTRWGSCNSRTGIRLNWRLIHLPAHLGDYVVAHELAHLKEMNHSPRFWAEVGRYFPSWREARAELKQLAATIPLI